MNSTEVRIGIVSTLVFLPVSFVIFNILPLQFKTETSECPKTSCVMTEMKHHVERTWKLFGGYHIFLEEFRSVSLKEKLRHYDDYQLSNTYQVWLSVLLSIGVGVAAVIAVNKLFYTEPSD